jgi:hypothetical protein
MRKLLQELLNSTSYSTVALVAGLTGGELPKLVAIAKKRPRSFVPATLAAGAVALGMGLGAAPESAFAAGPATCATVPPGAGGDYGAFAAATDAFACGQFAVANGDRSTALGAYSFAGSISSIANDNNTATGARSFAGSITGDASDNTATGAYSFAGSLFANAADNTATGAHSFAGSVFGDAVANTANGANSAAGSYFGAAYGNSASGANSAAGSFFGNAFGNTASGANSYAGSTNYTAIGNTAVGFNSFAGNPAGYALFNTAVGYNSTAAGYLNSASGSFSTAVGVGNSASGVASYAVGYGNSAFGTNARATGAFNTAVGTNTQATNAGSVAIGTDSDGDGAQSTLENEFVLGTDDHTYTAPGITSSQSRARQSGPLEVVTSDAEGHLATDGGEIFNRLDGADKRLDEAESGIALAISMEDPDLVDGERFGVRVNYGNFEGANALSWTFAGVLGRDVFRAGDRIAIGGGFGVGFEENNGDDVWGGRVGAQWTWGHAPASVAYR